MAIDIENESLLSLKQACKHPALARNGKGLHLATLYRLVHRGSRGGVRLEAIRTPGGWKTSRQAIARFIARLSDPETAQAGPTRSQCAEAHRHAEAALTAAGI